MKTQKKLHIILILTVLYICLFSFVRVSADTLDFTVEPEFSENQIDNKVSYFDLLVQPNSKEVINVWVTNNTKNTIKVKIVPTTAVTNENGIIDYSQSNPVIDLNTKNPFHSLVNPIPTIILKAYEKKKISIPINIPEKKFDGSILGALKFFQDDKKESESSGKIKIENQYFYIMGVRIREDKKDPTPKIELENVFLGKRNFNSVFLATLKNTTPTIIKPITLDYEIIEKKNNKIVLSDKKTKLSMAPISQFEFAIDLKNKNFKKGDYLLNLTVISEDKKWKFNKMFKLDEKQIHEINDNNNTSQPINFWIIFFIIIVIIVVILAFIYLVYFLTKRAR